MIFVNFIKDLISFYYYKKAEKKFNIGFFCEGEFIFNYIQPYLEKKILKTKVVLISFENILYKNEKNLEIFIFHTNFFRELFFLTLKLNFLYSSTPDLNNTIFKKSKFFRCKYIYLQHSPVSLNLIYNESAFDSFDAVQTINKFQYNEMKEIKKLKNLNLKIFKSKYMFVEKQKLIKSNHDKTQVLIAPSWNTQFYKLNCHLTLRKFLLENSISFKFRPHPMSFKKKEIDKEVFETLKICLDNSKFINFFDYDYLISDWSGIFIEYSLITNRKAFLLNTPKKILNKKFENFSNEPLEISLRHKFANTFEVDKIEELVKKINENKKDVSEENEIKKIIQENFY